MSKLSLEALKERAEAVASQDLLNSICGGTQNACHDTNSYKETPPTREIDNTSVRVPIRK
jgi:hypothetical protein